MELCAEALHCDTVTALSAQKHPKCEETVNNSYYFNGFIVLAQNSTRTLYHCMLTALKPTPPVGLIQSKVFHATYHCKQLSSFFSTW